MKIELKIHEKLKDYVWELRPEEFKQLEENILNEGIRDKLIIWDGYIVDGHNRYEIAQKHNLDFEVKEMDFDNIEQAQDWMDANQLGRRNLTQDQWQISIGRRYNRKKQQGARNDLTSGQIDHKSSTGKKLADEYNISPKSARRYAKKASVYEHMKTLKPEQAMGIKAGELSFKDIKKAKKKKELEKKKEEYAERVNATEGKSTDIFNTDKKYRVIYADPPWNYNDKQSTSQLGGATKHYHLMDIDGLSKLPIKDITEDDAVLFLWVTSPLLEECFDIIKGWGFKYKTSFVWDKVKHNMGHYNSVRHEFLLVCTKGSCTPDKKKLYDSVQSIEKTKKHSEKPPEFINIIDDLYQYGNRIELFARQTVDNNWDYWGNEI